MAWPITRTKGGGGYVNNYLALEGGMTGTASNGNLGLTTFGQFNVSTASTNIYISSSGGANFNHGSDPANPWPERGHPLA